MRWLLGAVLLLGLVVACDQGSAGSAWVELSGMETARSEHPGVVVDGQLVVIGGLAKTPVGDTFVTSSVERYDPSSDTWVRLEDLPERRHHSAAAVVDGRLFVIGGFSEFGFDAVDDVWEQVAGSWEPRASLPVPVGAAAAVVVQGDIYLVGGAPTGGLFRYDVEADTWKRLSSLGASREHLAAVALDGVIWALGGRWGEEMRATTEIYSMETDSWSAGPEMNEARSGFGAAVLGDQIYVAGGEVFNPTKALASTEVLRGGEWEPFEPLPVGLHGVPLVAIEGILYLPGGSDQAGAVSNRGELFSIEP